eukprot:CAMPEP_0179371880 /NCGR_PEP_ID=MMETSP0797-20121207/85961_1 /TAXON_ID=47934 /ORGANISM="Dinophysis acuminata, Strain DAEP01" /LENGTH=115 /DNA_ID=CAMNT_0021087761 /DNA_START=212 /DNA_END=555 /DNA_ORIENTATION=-
MLALACGPSLGLAVVVGEELEVVDLRDAELDEAPLEVDVLLGGLLTLRGAHGVDLQGPAGEDLQGLASGSTFTVQSVVPEGPVADDLVPDLLEDGGVQGRVELPAQRAVEVGVHH